LRGDSGDGGPVRLVVVRHEELARVDGGGDASAQRAFIGTPQRSSVGLIDEDRLDEHRQVLVAGGVAIRLADHPRDGSGDPVTLRP